MDNKVSNTTQPSRLYHIEPIGIGTPYVESLTSYIKRLAEAHCVSPANLLKKEILPDINIDYLKIYRCIGYEALNLNSMKSLISEEIIRVLEEKTYNYNLKYLTMITWKRCLCSANMFHKNQVWCPICYEESLQLNQPIYEQLIWSLKDINICGKHHVKLIRNCPYCNREFSTLNSLSQTGYCDNCKSWLGFKRYENNQIPLINEEWNNWVYDNVGQLLAVAPSLEQVNNLQFNKNIVSIIDSCNLSQRSLAKEINVASSTINKWTLSARPHFIDVLHLSFIFGYCVLDILTEDIYTLEKGLNKRMAIDKKENFKSNININDINKIKKALDEAICSNKLISLKQLSKSLGFKDETVKRHFPHEVIKIKANNDKYSKERELYRLKLIKDTMKLLFNRGTFPSIHAIEHEVNKKSLIRNTNEKRFWIDTLKELGCTSEDYHKFYGNMKKYDSFLD